MTTAASDSYDEVPYRSQAIADTHPDRLSAMASLFGHEAPDPETCRVLELGCARGDNIMAMATSLPRATFVGVDGAASQIAEGETRRVRAGLDNVRLVAADFSSLPEGLGEFDYVICHGVYSWLPVEIADRLLQLCRKHLAPAGVAYVSYNTYPGWSSKIILRDMLRFHVRALADRGEQIAEARNFVRFMARFAREEQGTYRRLFAELDRSLEAAPDHYLFHEYLEEDNRPVFFREFASAAARHGLRYVGPSGFAAWDGNLPPEVESAFAAMEDRVVREQYADFLCNRTFRRSLLARAEAPGLPAPSSGAVRALFTSARALPVSAEPDAASDAVEEFVTKDGDRIRTSRPLVKAVLVTLARSLPGYLAFDEIERRACGLLGESAKKSPDELEDVLLRAALSNLVRFACRAPAFAPVATERPHAAPLARIQAAEDTAVTNLLHRLVYPGDLERFVLQHCDGTHDRAALAGLVVSAVREGDGEPEAGGPRDPGATDPDRMRAAAVEAVDESLAKLAAQALFQS